MSKRRTYLHNAALLTGSGLVLRALGMGFRIVLAAYLGSEGMGLYQLILALYMVFVSFATAGVNVASARLAAQSLARGSGMAETLRGLCITALGFGTAAMLAQSALAGPCARYRCTDVRAETARWFWPPVCRLWPCRARCGGAFWPRGGCSRTSRRSSSNSWCGWPSPRRVCGRWRSGARATAAPPCCWQHGQRERLLRHYAGFCRTHAGICTTARAPLHPYTRKELYDILWPVEGSRLLASALQAAESSLIPYTLAIYTAAAPRPWPSTAA